MALKLLTSGRDPDVVLREARLLAAHPAPQHRHCFRRCRIRRACRLLDGTCPGTNSGGRSPGARTAFAARSPQAGGPALRRTCRGSHGGAVAPRRQSAECDLHGGRSRGPDGLWGRRRTRIHRARVATVRRNAALPRAGGPFRWCSDASQRNLQSRSAAVPGRDRQVSC